LPDSFIVSVFLFTCSSFHVASSLPGGYVNLCTEKFITEKWMMVWLLLIYERILRENSKGMDWHGSCSHQEPSTRFGAPHSVGWKRGVFTKKNVINCKKKVSVLLTALWNAYFSNVEYEVFCRNNHTIFFISLIEFLFPWPWIPTRLTLQDFVRTTRGGPRLQQSCQRINCGFVMVTKSSAVLKMVSGVISASCYT